VIERRRFHAGLAVDGPYVSDGDGDVSIGVSSIVELPLMNPNRDAAGPDLSGKVVTMRRWFAVKYGSELKIGLTGLSDAGRHEFSQKFGLPFAEYPTGFDDHGESFFRSDAFGALVKWMKLHPSAAKRLPQIQQFYIPKLIEKLEEAACLSLIQGGDHV
jgi:hypothetical protein